MSEPIRYTVTPSHPEAHLFRVTCTVVDPDPAGQVFRLPAWIPGSYMIREFARNIVSITAEAGGKAVRLDKLDKHSWRAARVGGGQALTVTCEIYAWDLSVRTAHLDQTHGFFNGTSLFLAVVGRENRPCLVDIRPPEGAAYAAWQVATTLRPAGDQPGAARPLGFGLYRADDHDELVDHPVEMGTFDHALFEAHGVPHQVAITGRHDCDYPRLCADLKRICEWQIELFGKPAPVDRYLFMTTVVGDGYGGLEHRASTALLANRADLPWAGMKGTPEGYVSFLGLCSHEYFHTWNVKRIKPAVFTPYDLNHENHTTLLWAFEGITSYYDDLTLVRSGVIDHDTYLGLLGKTITRVLGGSGRLKQSVAESSFDAWTKFYRQDENAPNAIVSYYAKGALIALALDLRLRTASGGRRSLDDVMRALWQRHGQSGVGVAEEGVFEIVAEVAAEVMTDDDARDIASALRRMVFGTADLPLARLLKPFGVEWRTEAVDQTAALGVKVADGNGGVRLANVLDGGPAQRAGLSAGDVLIALDGLKLDVKRLEALLGRCAPGDRVELHAFRRDELMRFEVELVEPPKNLVRLAIQQATDAPARKLRKGWLGS